MKMITDFFFNYHFIFNALHINCKNHVFFKYKTLFKFSYLMIIQQVTPIQKLTSKILTWTSILSIVLTMQWGCETRLRWASCFYICHYYYLNLNYFLIKHKLKLHLFSLYFCLYLNFIAVIISVFQGLLIKWSQAVANASLTNGWCFV